MFPVFFYSAYLTEVVRDTHDKHNTLDLPLRQHHNNTDFRCAWTRNHRGEVLKLIWYHVQIIQGVLNEQDRGPLIHANH